MDRSNYYLYEEIGIIGSGCGLVNVDRVMRRVKFVKDIKEFEFYLMDVVVEVNDVFDDGKFVLIEGI